MTVLLEVDPTTENLVKFTARNPEYFVEYKNKCIFFYHYRWRFRVIHRHMWNLRTICGILFHQFLKNLSFAEIAYIRSNWQRSTVRKLRNLRCRRRFCMQNPRAFKTCSKPFIWILVFYRHQIVRSFSTQFGLVKIFQ